MGREVDTNNKRIVYSFKLSSYIISCINIELRSNISFTCTISSSSYPHHQTRNCLYIYIYICSKITLILRAQYWTGTGVELPNILGYQTAHILTLVLKSNFLLLLLYLGCAANQRSIPLGYLLHLLGQGHSVLVCV